MEIEKEQYYIRYTKEEFDEITKIMVKLAIDSFFEYTEDENNIICIGVIKSYTQSKLNYYWNKSGIDTPSFWSRFFYGIYQQ